MSETSRWLQAAVGRIYGIPVAGGGTVTVAVTVNLDTPPESATSAYVNKRRNERSCSFYMHRAYWQSPADFGIAAIPEVYIVYIVGIIR